MPRKSFSIHSDYYRELCGLTMEQRSDMLLALIEWANDGEVSSLDPMCAMLFRLMTAQTERISSANSANGSMRGKAKEANDSEISEAKRNKPTVTDTVSVSETIDTPIGVSTPHTPRKRGERDECAELFDVFWTHYPRKTAKQNALKAWQKLRPGKETAQTIIAAVRDQAKSPQWTRDDGQYIPHAATWLNGRRWEDEVQKQAPVPAAPRQRSVPAQQYTQREYTSERLRELVEKI